ncbi:DMT family transporter [Halothiobacillus sp. DCM-1]|uniref:DMT family transporter n=1 Tax=Halothiobacillus sp. DCM-1 TaxID=3112558 RepID=UPI00324400BF
MSPARLRLPPPVWVLMFGSTCWGLTWIWLKHIETLGVGPVLLSTIAYGAQFLLCLPWVWPQFRRWRHRPDERPIALHWLLLLALLSGVSGIGFTVAMVYGDVIRSILLFFLLPAWGVLMGHVFLREALSLQRIVTLTLALIGAFTLLAPDLTLGFKPADLAALGAGLALAAANVLFRYLQNEPMVVKLSVMQLGGAVFGLLIWLLLPESLDRLTLNGLAQSALYGVTLLLAAMIATQYAVERLPAGRSSVLMTLELVVASGTALWIGHEHPSLWVWLGGGLIVAAALIEANTHSIGAAPGDGHA